MGILFNTPATIDIITKLNARYDGKTARGGDIVHHQKIATHGGGKARDVAAALALTPDDAKQSIATKPTTNWNQWLDFLDLHDNAKDVGKKCSETVGNAIVSALTIDNKYVIEFYAVPDCNSTGFISVDCTTVNIPSGPVLCITAYTMTFDQLNNQAH